MNEIRNTSTNKKTPFARWNIVRKSAMEFDEDPKFRINSKDVSIKEYTNNNAVDTNIYEVIEKYRGDLKMTAEQLNQFHTEIAQELSEIKNLPDALIQMKRAEEAWKGLPLDTRQQFGNSIQRFVKNGKTYLDGKIKEYNDAIKAQEEAQKRAEALAKEQTANKGVTNNG